MAKSTNKNMGIIVAIIVIILAIVYFTQKQPTAVVGKKQEIKVGIILGFTGPIESLTPAMAASA